MATVLDVAEYIVRQTGPITAMKLQKLVYYAQAWSLVWDDMPLFSARIEAWANGPVCPKLYQKHRGEFQVERGMFSKTDPSRCLSAEQRETIDAVVKHYGRRSSQYLSDLTHCERPWADARKGLKAGERGAQPITHESMAEYYASL